MLFYELSEYFEQTIVYVFYMVPDKSGKYPVIFMFHGAGEKISSNWEYRAYIMDTVNKWIALGYMDPIMADIHGRHLVERFLVLFII